MKRYLFPWIRIASMAVADPWKHIDFVISWLRARVEGGMSFPTSKALVSMSYEGR